MTLTVPMPVDLGPSPILSWQIEPAYRSLFNVGGPALKNWISAGKLRIVKHGPHRTVYHLATRDGCFFIKRNRIPNARAWMRQLVRVSKARAEFHKAKELARRGIRTITPVAVGECPGWSPGESWLITVAISDTLPFDEFLETHWVSLPPADRQGFKRRVTAGLAAFVARLHAAGVCHNDFHPGNLLIKWKGLAEPEFYLVDLSAVRLGPPLAWPARRNNLIIFNHWFSMRAQRPDRLRFWKAYCGAAGQSLIPPASEKPWARDLENQTWRSNLRFWRSRDRRCLETNRHYTRWNRANSAGEALVGHAVAQLSDLSLAALTDHPEALFAGPAAGVLKNSKRSMVTTTTLTEVGPASEVIVKRFLPKHPQFQKLIDCFRPSAALVSWVLGHGLRERCLPTPQPMVVFRLALGPARGTECLVTRQLTSAQTLRDYVAQGEPARSREALALWRSRIDELARLIRELHRRQLSHRDLKAGNILLSPDGTAYPSTVDFGPFHLIDLVGVRLYRRLSRQRRVQNLARLNASFVKEPKVSNSDRLRFLRVYSQWGLLGKKGWKDWWKQIAKATQRKIDLNKRRGRVLA